MNKEKRPAGRGSGFLERSFPALYDDCRITIDGPGCMTVEGCGGVLAYTDSFIRFGLKRCVLQVTGCDLSLSSMSGSTACVTGRISSVEFV